MYFYRIIKLFYIHIIINVEYVLIIWLAYLEICFHFTLESSIIFSNCWKRTISTHLKRGYPFTFQHCMKFLFVRPDVCRRLPLDSTSRWTPLPWAMWFPLLGLTRDLHPLDNAHAERTKMVVQNNIPHHHFLILGLNFIPLSFEYDSC